MIGSIGKGFSKVFGSRNDRLVKAYHKRVEHISTLEPEVRRLTDAQLKAKTDAFRKRIRDGEKPGTILPEVMAVAREVMDRSVGIRNIFNPEHAFDVEQLAPDMQKIYKDIQIEIDQLEPEPVRGGEPAPPWMQVEIPIALYEAVRDLYPQSKPPFRARPFDVQLIGGMVLGEGKIAEMRTGEGKTIVAPLACYVAAIEGLKCHIVTVNDYLVQRDRDWVFPFYYWMGLTVGAIHPMHMQPHELKADAYRCDAVYGTNSEFGFDYLRDNMKDRPEIQVQHHRDFCIVDEIDSILIDEARTPLIISGAARDDVPRYELADQLARHLQQVQKEWNRADEKVQQAMRKIKGLEGDIRNAADKSKVPAMREEMARLEKELPGIEAERDQHTQYYEVEMDKKAAHLTHEGVAEAQKQAGIGSFYVGNNMDMPHLLENSLRAHVVYKRDKDYVVEGGEVIIVDENTGRKMIGRQWSDGLHQAVEAKEKVKIKQETQTLATITIQNFFKMYKRLAGMTGTAATEANEFAEIYSLDVVSIPTNRPVIRDDRNDLVFLSAKDKWFAILDEIRLTHDVGRPVLVGTTSVEKSEMLSEMLTKKTGIQHEVLNAKIDQAERESLLVEHAGELGAVMIATNMAGRGTDIRLARIKREDLVRHWQLRNILPKQANPEMSDEELINLAYRHMASTQCGLKAKEVESMSDDEAKLHCLRKWIETEAYIDASKAQSKTADECLSILDEVPNFLKHRLKVYHNIEEMGGLHIVGTERHDSRRIDNQLRGRAGRQGDKGSSRFFISLEDDLMQMFAGPTTMKALSRLGMREGDAIEHRWITKSVERAQRKVEERDFERRKSLLEYDEVMEYQRREFYGTRQNILEGKEVDELIFKYINESTQIAGERFLQKAYVQEQLAEFVQSQLDVSVDPSRLPLTDVDDLTSRIRREAIADVQQTVEVTIGEYMSNDVPREEWDLRGLSSWAMSRYAVDLKVNQLKRMEIEEVSSRLIEAAREQVERKEISGVEKYLDPLYGEKQLSQWVEQQFGIEVSPEELGEITGSRSERIAKATGVLIEKAHDAYAKREVTYPVEYVMDVIIQLKEQDPQYAAEQLCEWAKSRYDLEWSVEQVKAMNGQEIYDALHAESKAWLQGGKLEEAVDRAIGQHGGDTKSLATWAEQRFGRMVEASELEDAQGRRAVLIEKGRDMLRSELTTLERFVLLQILDKAWKDHLYDMDRLKDGIGLHAYAEKDPKIMYKTEGAKQFKEMQQNVRERVTELIFRARLTPNVQAPRNVYQGQEARHDEAEPAAAGVRTAGATAAQSADHQADMEAADRAGTDRDANLTRKQRRARAAKSGSESRGGGKGGYKKRKRR